MRPVLEKRPILGLLRFPFFCRHLGYLGLGTQNASFIPFDPQNGPFYTLERYVLKGTYLMWTRKNTMKLRKQAPKGQMATFFRMWWVTPFVGTPAGSLSAPQPESGSPIWARPGLVEVGRGEGGRGGQVSCSGFLQ